MLSGLSDAVHTLDRIDEFSANDVMAEIAALEAAAGPATWRSTAATTPMIFAAWNALFALIHGVEGDEHHDHAGRRNNRNQNRRNDGEHAEE